MKTRVIVVALATVLAMVLGLAAPEPSSAIAYRIVVVAFVIDLAAARCAAVGILTLGPLSGGYDESDFPPPCLTASKLRQEAKYYDTPLVVRDPGVALALSY